LSPLPFSSPLLPASLPDSIHRWLLKKITLIYLHFVKYPEFATHVSHDGNFKKNVFFESGNLLIRTNLITEEVHEIWKRFVGEVGAKAEEDARAEEELGEIPDEFCGTFLNF
jgi:hypothetical protein